MDTQWSRALVDNRDTSWRTAKPGTPIPFTASTPSRARDGLELRVAGWLTDRYERNGVLLWAHQQAQPPIGRTEVGRGDSLRGMAYFDQDDEFAVAVERKYRKGIMNGFSVGWDFVDEAGRSIDWRRTHPDELRDHAFYDLAEISAVPVPSDPGALTERAWSGLQALSTELGRAVDRRRTGATRQALSEALRRNPDPGPAASGINQAAARDFLAAFTREGTS
jgi:hypothetical protein